MGPVSSEELYLKLNIWRWEESCKLWTLFPDAQTVQDPYAAQQQQQQQPVPPVPAAADPNLQQQQQQPPAVDPYTGQPVPQQQNQPPQQLQPDTTVIDRLVQRLLHYWTEMSFCGAYHISPTFSELFVTKPVITQGTNRYKMKDMDIIFPLAPLNFLWVKWFGYYNLPKNFFRNS